MMPTSDLELNQRALGLCRQAESGSKELAIGVTTLKTGAKLLDFGVESTGSLEAGILLARICMADLGEVSLFSDSQSAKYIHVRTQQPVAACLAAQYAGWEIKQENFFAMGSGPMRAAAAVEPLFEEIGLKEEASHSVGVLESGKLPTDDVCQYIAKKCGIATENLTLCIAPTHSLAGTVQIVARSVETALHKLHEFKFDLAQIVSGSGYAPLPPLVDDDLAAIGRTNDAILYGSEVTLQIRGEDEMLKNFGEQTPSSASPDYGRPFAEILAAYDNDFYRVDPLLFAPAVLILDNLDTGSSFRFGTLNPEVLAKSFSE